MRLITDKLTSTAAACRHVDMSACNMQMFPSLWTRDTSGGFEVTFNDLIMRNTCVGITAFNLRLDILHLSRRWIISAKNVVT